jgi:hypothetical protein
VNAEDAMKKVRLILVVMLFAILCHAAHAQDTLRPKFLIVDALEMTNLDGIESVEITSNRALSPVRTVLPVAHSPRISVMYGQRIDAQRWAVATKLASLTNQPVDYVYGGLTYRFIKGGNVNFQIDESIVNLAAATCNTGRCGLMPSLHFKGRDLVHLDTANPQWLPVGTLVHLVVDLCWGNLNAQAPLPRSRHNWAESKTIGR